MKNNSDSYQTQLAATSLLLSVADADEILEKEELETIFSKNQEINKIFIGPLTSEDTRFINKFCENQIIVFSFYYLVDLVA